MIDVHTHVGRPFRQHPRLTARALLRFMDRRNIARAVVLPIESPEETHYYVPTHEVLKAIRGLRRRLIPFCNVDPRREYPGRFDPEPLLREYKAMGCRGLGEVLAGLPVDSPLTARLYEACAKLRLPALLHMDDWINRDTLQLAGLEKVLKRHPRVRFIAHGPAFWRAISGRAARGQIYPRGRVAPGGAAGRLLATRPNLYADLSAESGHNALARDPGFGLAFLERHWRKLLFGTDYLYPGQRTPILDLLRRAPLRPSTYRAITHANARRLLRL